MAKFRVYEIAKKYNKDNKEILEILKANHVEVKNHMSTIGDEQIKMIENALKPKKEAKQDHNSKKQENSKRKDNKKAQNMEKKNNKKTQEVKNNKNNSRNKNNDGDKKILRKDNPQNSQKFGKNNKKKFIDHVEVYNQDGIYYFIYEGGKLIPDEKKPFENYFTITDSKGNIQGYNWLKIPLVPFKFNAKEIPLIRKLKSLQDGLNLIESNFLNQMEEDVRNTILVLVNYDGQNLAEFRKNLAEYGTVKVKTIDGAPGDLKTLQIEVNSENYKVIIDLFKKAIIENARGYDAKDDRLGNNPNQMNIQSIFSDIDLDANGTETEYQAAFEEVLWFINCHLANTGCGNFENENVDIIFNRDMLISESEIIDNINKSSDLSLESRLAQHPWVDDVQAEMDRIEKEKKNEIEQYPFPNQFGNNSSKTQPNEGGDVIDGEQE